MIRIDYVPERTEHCELLAAYEVPRESHVGSTHTDLDVNTAKVATMISQGAFNGRIVNVPWLDDVHTDLATDFRAGSFQDQINGVFATNLESC